MFSIRFIFFVAKKCVCANFRALSSSKNWFKNVKREVKEVGRVTLEWGWHWQKQNFERRSVEWPFAAKNKLKNIKFMLSITVIRFYPFVEVWSITWRNIIIPRCSYQGMNMLEILTERRKKSFSSQTIIKHFFQACLYYRDVFLLVTIICFCIFGKM